MRRIWRCGLIAVSALLIGAAFLMFSALANMVIVLIAFAVGEGLAAIWSGWPWAILLAAAFVCGLSLFDYIQRRQWWSLLIPTAAFCPCTGLLVAWRLD